MQQQNTTISLTKTKIFWKFGDADKRIGCKWKRPVSYTHLPEAMALAARWQAELASPFAQPADCVQRPARTVSPSVPRHAAQQVQNPRWQSILAVLATV